MKKNTKRILSLILVLMMVVSLFPSAYAAETEDPFVDEDYGSAWGDWDDQPAEEPAPVEEEPAEDPFIEEPAEDPFAEEPVEEPAPVVEPVEEPVPVEEPAVEEEPVEVPCPANTFYYVGGSGLRVTVDAPEGAFPIDAEMSVSELPASFVQDVVAASGVEGQVLVAADISFANSEGELQPNGKVKVSITSAEAARVTNVKVVHIDDNYNVEEVDQLPEFDANVLFTDAVATMSVADERTLSFEADSFSVYAIVGEVVIDADEGSYDFETEDYVVTVSFTKEALIPYGTKLVVSQVEFGSEEYWNLWKQSLAKLNENATFGDEVEPDTRKGIAAAVFFDVSLICEGQKIEPAVPLQVDIKLKSEGLLQIEGEETKVIHFGQEGTELIDQVNVVSSGASLDGMPEGAMVNDFRYVQDGFSVVGVFTTDEFIDFENAVEYEPVGKLGASKGATRAAGDTIAAGKTVTDTNNDGIYELALTVTGASQSSTTTEVVKSNVILVIDTSRSMVSNSVYSEYTYSESTYSSSAQYYRQDGNDYSRVYYGTVTINNASYTGWYYQTGNWWNQSYVAHTGTVYLYETRMAATRRAAKALASALLEGNDPNDENLKDVMEISIVEFARTDNNESGIRSSQQTTEAAVYATIDAFTDANANNGHTGTNWCEGLRLAKQEADDKYASQTGETTSIIFLTDGMPTYWLDSSNTQQGNGYENQNDNVTNSYNYARSFARAILWNSDGSLTGYNFYSIFAYGSGNGSTYLNNLTASANTNTNVAMNASTATQSNFYNATNTKQLEEAFEAIVHEINDTKGYAGVNIADGVSLGATSTSVAVNGSVDDSKMRYSVSKGSATLYDVSISDGTATFTIYDGDPATVLSTDQLVAGDPGIEDGKTHYIYKVTKGTGDSAVTYMMAPASIDPDTGMVKWDLAGLGILDDGVTYKLAFDVWPNQITYDIAADLNNGIYTSVDAAVAAYQAKEGFDDDEAALIKNALHKNEETGAYEIYTNYEQNIEYYEAESQTDENGNTTWSYGDKKTVPLKQPDPIPLKGSKLPMKKEWAVQLADSELHDLLYNKDGTPTKYGVTLHLWKEDTEEEVLAKSAQPASSSNVPYQSFPLGWDEDAGENGDYVWSKGAAVAPGMMVNLAEAARLGFNTNDTSKIYSFTREGETVATQYYIVEPGHYYMVSEEGGDLHFQLFTEVYHPMIVDGTLYDVALISEGGTNTVKEMISMAAVVATNTLKGGLNISKVVSTTQINVTDGVIGGVTQPVDDYGIKTVTDEFTYEIQIWKEDENGAKTAVYTTPDQIESDGSATISGSVGYRIFSEPRLEDGSIKYTQKRGAILTESDENASLANGIYATIANGVTTITLTMPANGEIRLVNLPSNTKYTVREIVEDGGAYAYAATLSQQKLSDTEVTEGTVSTGNTVSGSVPGNTAAVETYYNWASNFYVYHSSDNTVEKISFSDNRVKGTYDEASGSYSYDFNIVDETKSGFLYGGYYGDYGGKSSALVDDDHTTVAAGIAGLTYGTNNIASDKTGCKSYDASSLTIPNTTVKFWVRANEGQALRESGMEYTGGGKSILPGDHLNPKSGDVYFLKEVPDTYLHNRIQYIYDWQQNNTIEQLFTMTAIDDSLYKEIGFDIIVTENGYKKAKVCTKYTIKSNTPEQTTAEIVASDINGVPRGYVGFYDDGTDKVITIAKNTEFIVTPNWTTIDGIKVLGAPQGYIFNDIVKGGIAKTDKLPQPEEP